MVAAGCPWEMARRIAESLPDTSTEDIRDYVTAELLRYGETKAAESYRSYRADFTPAAIRVIRLRYLLRGRDGLPKETPTELIARVAICMAMPELRGAPAPEAVHGFRLSPYHNLPYDDLCAAEWPDGGSKNNLARFADAMEKYHAMMIGRRFLPNSPTLMNAGGPLGQLSACFVLDMPDTLEGIFDTGKTAALVFQSGGGVGINYSTLRPAGARVGSTAGVASGPISFMGMVDKIGDVVKQGGRRRAANMGILDASHQDIMDFIRAKRVGAALNNFNISVGTDADFWVAIESDSDYYGRKASAILDEIADSAHKSAEPGMIFFDSHNKHNMLEKARGGPLRSTNPCWGGETRVLTKSGPKTFRELADGNGKVRVLTREDDGSLSYRVMVDPGITARDAEVVCLVVESKQTGECMALRCTPNHQVFVVEGDRVEKRAVNDLTPGMSLASLYLDNARWEQTVGMTVAVNDVPENAMEGTGHPSPTITPMSLVSRKGKGEKKKKKEAEGFLTPEGNIPDATSGKKPGRLSKLFRKNHTVRSVIPVGNKTDVFNGMVETTHNYFVECGEGHYILSSNCGEQALYPNESCNLGSLNLAEYLVDGEMEWDMLAEETHLATRMLDGVVDMTRHPTPDIKRASWETRRIGLGVMGVADMLMYMDIPYKSPEAYRLFGRLAEFISYHSMAESVLMAAERGPFPLYDRSAYLDGRLPFAGEMMPFHDWEHRPLMPWDDLKKDIRKHGIRNVLTTTIAPTGTISMIAGCSSGIEPIFSLGYTKTVGIGSFQYGCPALTAKHPDILDAVAAAGGTIPEGLIPDADVYITARQIHWADHILAQAAWQRWIGNSISKTINMAASVTVSDIRDAYVMAHKLGCRGVTVYRDGSRDTQVLESGEIVDDPIPSDIAARCMV